MLGGSPHEARFIVDEALGTDAGSAGWAALVPASAVADARAMAARRAAGEPLQYVFGHWSFRDLELQVDPRVLIPRPETEQVVEVALAEARRSRWRGAGVRAPRPRRRGRGDRDRCDRPGARHRARTPCAP